MPLFDESGNIRPTEELTHYKLQAETRQWGYQVRLGALDVLNLIPPINPTGAETRHGVDLDQGGQRPDSPAFPTLSTRLPFPSPAKGAMAAPANWIAWGRPIVTSNLSKEIWRDTASQA